MSHIIEVLMLSAASLILLFTKTDGIKAAKGSVFNAGMHAVVAIFGIAWMGDTFIAGNMEVMKENILALLPICLGCLVCLVPDVHLVVQSGSYRSFSVTARHSTRHFSLYAYRAFPSCERLFFPAQLSDSDSRHKL